MRGHRTGYCGVSLACLMLALGAGHVRADDKLSYAPAPDWVKHVEIPKPDPSQADAPLQFLLQDIQLNFGPDGDSTYSEFTLKIQSPQGLQAAQSFVVWNPDTDAVTINKAVIIRDGQVIDLLKGQTYTVVRRETNIERSMLDGMLTGVLQPEGLQVGDTVDYAMTVRRHDPVLHDNSQTLVPVSSALPIGRVFLRASWDASRPVQFRQTDALPKGALTTTKAGSTFLLQTDGYKAPAAPSDAPGRFSQGGYVEFSQFAAWRDISRLMAPLFDKAATLSPSSPLKDEAAKIRAASPDPKTQAAAALKLVETNVRYLYLGMNQGSYIPADADTTWQRRFGDCKGKTVMLLALLRELGIHAEAAAVSTGAGDGLDAHLPSLQLFDHVIVRAEIAGKVYWLDPTRLGDRDLDSLRVPPYVWALPLRQDGADLEALKMQPYEKPETETSIQLDASAGLDVPARAHIETISRYDSALSIRLGMESLNTTDKDKALKDYWKGQYDWITPTKVSATYDEATGEMHLVMDGDAAMQWDKTDKGDGWEYTTDATPIGWGDGLQRDPGPHMDAPMTIMFPNYYLTREEIDLPKNGKGFTVKGASFDKTMAGTQFHRAVALKGNVFTLEMSKRSTVSEIPYAEAMKVNTDLTKMWADTVTVIAPLNAKAGATTAAPVQTDTPVTADDFAARGGQRIASRDQDGALADFNQALRLDPVNSRALQGRAFIFLVRGKYDAALVDCQQAVKTDPTAWMAYNCVGQAYMAKRQYGDAVDADTKALALYPNNIMALQGRAAAYGAMGEKDKARTDAQAALDLDPAATWAISILVELSLEDGKPDEAEAIVDKALAANPDEQMLIRQKIWVIENCRGLNEDACYTRKTRAVPYYDKLIAAEPNAQDYALRAQDRAASDRQAAMDDIDQAIKLNPKDATPYLVRAAINMRDKAYGKALDDANAALAAEPGDEQSLSIRSTIYFKLNRTDEAMADIDAVTAKHPDDAGFLNNACWGRATHNIQLDKALEQCTAAVRIQPDAMHILDSKAFVELRLGQYDAAIADYDTVLAKEPTLAPSLYGRGLAKIKKGQAEAGKTDLEAARKVSANIDADFKAYGMTP